MSHLSTLAGQVIDIAEQAGKAILSIYHRDFAVMEKADESPLTEADLAAHEIIIQGLQAISDLPILSEESADIPWSTRKHWQRYWLVDPLDGTKEFIKKNGEFTVNIALIDKGVPILGVVYAPVLNWTYVGDELGNAVKIENGEVRPLTPQPHTAGALRKVVGSRSHQSPQIQDFLTALPGETELVAMGSSLKLCLVAEGKAHLYPRLGPTSEWDTAAAHAVVLAAGGKVTVIEHDLSAEEAEPLRYNTKDSLLNPFFLVSC